MCSQREKVLINNVNRTIIALAGIAGTLLDGFHSSDVLCITSMMIWLCQNECSLVEEKCMDQLKQLLVNNKAIDR